MDPLRRSSTVINDGDLGAIPDYYAAYPMQTTQAGCSSSAFWQEETERTTRYALRDTSMDPALNDEQTQYSGDFSRSALNIRYSGTGNRSACVPDMPEEFFGQMVAEDYHDNQYKTKRDYTASRYTAFGVKPTDSTIGDMETGPNADNYIIEPAYRRMQERRMHEVDYTMVNEAPKIWISQKGSRQDPDGDIALSYNEAYNREAYSPIIRKHVGDWAQRTVMDSRLADEWYSQQKSVRVLDRVRVMNQSIDEIDHTFFNRGATANTLRSTNRNDAQLSEREREHAYETAIRKLAVKKTTQHVGEDTSAETMQLATAPVAAVQRERNVTHAESIHSGAAAEIYTAPNPMQLYNAPTNLSDIIRTHAAEEIAQSVTRVDKHGRPVSLIDNILTIAPDDVLYAPAAADVRNRPVNLAEPIAHTADHAEVQPSRAEHFSRPVNLADEMPLLVIDDDDAAPREKQTYARGVSLADDILTICDEDDDAAPNPARHYERAVNLGDTIQHLVIDDGDAAPNPARHYDRAVNLGDTIQHLVIDDGDAAPNPARHYERAVNLGDVIIAERPDDPAHKPGTQVIYKRAVNLSDNISGLAPECAVFEPVGARQYGRAVNLSEAIQTGLPGEIAVCATTGANRLLRNLVGHYMHNTTHAAGIQSHTMPELQQVGPRRVTVIGNLRNVAAIDSYTESAISRMRRAMNMPAKMQKFTLPSESAPDRTLDAPVGTKKVRFADKLTNTTVGSAADTTLAQTPVKSDQKSLYNTQQLAVVAPTGRSLYNMHLTNSVEKLNNIVPTIVDLTTDGQAMVDVRKLARATRVATGGPISTVGDIVVGDAYNYNQRPTATVLPPARLKSHAAADGKLVESSMSRVTPHGLHGRRMRLSSTMDHKSYE